MRDIISTDFRDFVELMIDAKQKFDRLPPKQRRAVALYQRGFSYSEIAKKRGVSRQSVSRVFRRIVDKCAD